MDARLERVGRKATADLTHPCMGVLMGFATQRNDGTHRPEFWKEGHPRRKVAQFEPARAVATELFLPPNRCFLVPRTTLLVAETQPVLTVLLSCFLPVHADA